MNIIPKIRRWRDWFPVPKKGGQIDIIRWVLLEANRMAVTGALLTFVFIGFLGLSTVWTIEMQDLLNETSAVQTLLNTFLSGMILLVSIVVSINSIVLSHDMSPLNSQGNRIHEATKFRRILSEFVGPDEDPSEPMAFLSAMSGAINERAEQLKDDVTGLEADFVEEIEEYTSSIEEAADMLGDIESTTGGEFALLWKGIEFQYGSQLEQLQSLKSTHISSSEIAKEFDSLIEALKLFAMGKEYFKTLYYTHEISHLSQTLLVITLPAILINATTILAINAGILPEFWFFGIPPLQTFVAASFTISLAPYIVLTSYMLRLAAVARLTSSADIFSLT
jgi:hypothetical protein